MTAWKYYNESSHIVLIKSAGRKLSKSSALTKPWLLFSLGRQHKVLLVVTPFPVTKTKASVTMSGKSHLL
jgi:hypothetical protein